MSSTSSSSPSPSKAKRPVGSIQGRRPQPLIVSATAAEESRPSKKPRVSAGGDTGPVIVYELTPRVVHARPEEFMAVVQKLTGKQSTAPVAQPPSASSSTVTLAADQVAGEGTVVDTAAATAADPLVLALGQQSQPSPPAIDEHWAPPSPAAAFLLSPSSLFLSPTTVHFLQELGALF